jgi:ABC-type branched-subunit amino acid transport system substrate-binding protein
VYLLYNAINAAQSTERDAVRDALKNADMYEGVTGNIKFNDSGDPSKPAVMIQIVGGKFKYLDTVQP